MSVSHLPRLDELDVDGAIQEAAAKVDASSRASFLRKAGVGAGAVALSGTFFGVLADDAEAQVPSSDAAILNFALTLEYLEAEFYTQAARSGFGGKPGQLARVVGAHERAHVAFLRKTLGSAAVKKPKFNFKGTTADAGKFLATAKVLEETGVMAYAGQGPRLKTKALVVAALSIHSVEARHAAWVRDILGGKGANTPAPVAFDQPKSMEQILAAVGKTGFIVG